MCMIGILKEGNQINGVQQKVQSVTQENFLEVKDDFKPQI